jgi:hypothetical protein
VGASVFCVWNQRVNGRLLDRRGDDRIHENPSFDPPSSFAGEKTYRQPGTWARSGTIGKPPVPGSARRLAQAGSSAHLTFPGKPLTASRLADDDAERSFDYEVRWSQMRRKRSFLNLFGRYQRI